MPKTARQQWAEVQLSPELVRAELETARLWATQAAVGGGVILPSFENIRPELGTNAPSSGTGTGA